MINSFADGTVTISADELAKRIGRAVSTVVKVASKLAVHGRIERLPGLDVYSKGGWFNTTKTGKVS